MASRCRTFRPCNPPWPVRILPGCSSRTVRSARSARRWSRRQSRQILPGRLTGGAPRLQLDQPRPRRLRSMTALHQRHVQVRQDCQRSDYRAGSRATRFQPDGSGSTMRVPASRQPSTIRIGFGGAQRGGLSLQCAGEHAQAYAGALYHGTSRARSSIVAGSMRFRRRGRVTNNCRPSNRAWSPSGCCVCTIPLPASVQCKSPGSIR